MGLNRDLALDGRVWVVASELEIFEGVVEDALRPPFEREPWERSCIARELLLHLRQVIQVNVRIAAIPDEVAHLQVALLRHHVSEQRVAGDVERNTKEHVGAALVERTREPSFCHVELKQHVAWLKCHLLKLSHIPRRYNDAT